MTEFTFEESPDPHDLPREAFVCFKTVTRLTWEKPTTELDIFDPTTGMIGYLPVFASEEAAKAAYGEDIFIMPISMDEETE